MAATSSIPDRVQRAPFAAGSRDAAPSGTTSRHPGRPVRPQWSSFADDHGLFDDEPVARPAPARPVRRARPWLRIGFASAAVILGLSYLANKREPQDEEAAPAPVPQAS